MKPTLLNSIYFIFKQKFYVFKNKKFIVKK